VSIANDLETLLDGIAEQAPEKVATRNAYFLGVVKASADYEAELNRKLRGMPRKAAKFAAIAERAQRLAKSFYGIELQG
jgi:hypothetical protein